MKQFWKEVGIALLLGMILPGILLHLAIKMNAEDDRDMRPVVEKMTEAAKDMTVSVLQGQAVSDMELEEYLTGVVLAEMPADFEKEALKAQAVVARTYTLRAANGKSKHDTADICTDSNCCQAYRDPNDYLQHGGMDEDLRKVRNAVHETAGLVLTYQGELIEATYFSCSGGSTEDAVAVWGADVPYLQATPSPGEENAAHYSDSMTVSSDDLARALNVVLQGDPSDWFGAVRYTAGGGVDTILIGGECFLGKELRKLLGLRSTAFTVTTGDDSVTFHTRGYGHRVGMSQYGADAMAAGGSDFREILAHYYKGTELQNLHD